MKFLSQIVARAYCPAAVPAGPDRFFAVGCHAVGSSWLPADAADAARIAAQAKSLDRGGKLPWEPDGPLDGVFNDLFSPFRDDSDGRFSVWIPVPIEEALSSTLMAHDWRVFAMAWWAARRVELDPSRRVTVVAFDASERMVSADIKAEDLYSGMEFASGSPGGSHEAPGASCASCSRALSCKGLEAFNADYGKTAGPTRNETDELRARRLLSERALVSLKIEQLDRRKAIVDAELEKLVRNGLLRLGDGEGLEVPVRVTAAWDFGAVHRALMSRGLWDDSLGSIRSAELQRKIPNYPPDLAKALGKAKTDKTSQPSISEAARHGRFATRAPFLGGIAGK